MRGCFAALAFTLLALALSRHGGHYDATSVGLVVLALAVSLTGACWRVTPGGDARAARLWPWLAGAVTIGNLAGLSSRSPGTYLVAGTSLAPFRAGLVAATVLAASYMVPAGRARWLDRARLPLLIAIFLALGAWTINASPAPAIDVWHFHQRAAAVLLDGQNPWATDYPNIYGSTDFIADALLANGRVISYPYPPLSLLLTVPGTIAGDARWSTLAAVAGTAAFAVAAARRRGLPDGHVAELGAVMLLFHTRSFLMIEQGWTEPFVALSAAACAWALGHRPAALAVAIGSLLSVKQYGFLLLPALWRQGRVGARALVSGAAIAVAIALPFFLWDPAALWRGVVFFQIAQPFRMDALSVLVWWAHVFGTVPSQTIGFVTAAAAAALCWIRAPRFGVISPSSVMLTGAATYLAFFAFQKQSAFNYYWFASALLAIVMTTAPADAGRSAS